MFTEEEYRFLSPMAKYEGKKAFVITLPNGHELGATSEWVNGAYTRGGAAEFVLVNSGEIKHFRNVDRFLSNFIEVKQIK